MLQQIPRVVIIEPPSLVMLALHDAEEAVMLVGLDIEMVILPLDVLKVILLPYTVPVLLVAYARTW